MFQAEVGIRDLARSRGLGEVYKRQLPPGAAVPRHRHPARVGDDPALFALVADDGGEHLSLIHI